MSHAPQTTESDEPEPSLAETLEAALQGGGPEGPSVGELSGAVGEKGFGLILMVLSLPSALPVPAPGYSTPFGIAIMLIAAQMFAHRKSLWLPERTKRLRIGPGLASKMVGAASKFLRKIEHLIRPRQHWVRSRAGQSALAALVAVMASLMILPIPLTNTFPAMVIFMIGIGLSEEDGLVAIGAFTVGIAAVALYAFVIYLVITQGPEAAETIKDTIKGLLGLGEG